MPLGKTPENTSMVPVAGGREEHPLKAVPSKERDIVRLLEARMVADMTPVHADAMIKVARLTHTVPAKERTKQSVEETRRSQQDSVRLAIRAVAVVLIAAALIWLATTESGKQNIGAIVAAVAAVAVVLGADVPKLIEQARKHIGGAATSG